MSGNKFIPPIIPLIVEISGKSVPLSNKEVAVLGYGAAGWHALTTANLERNKVAYEFGKTILPPGEVSIYSKHSSSKLEEKTMQKQGLLKKGLEKEIETCLNALPIQTKKNILQDIHVNIGMQEEAATLQENNPFVPQVYDYLGVEDMEKLISCLSWSSNVMKELEEFRRDPKTDTSFKFLFDHISNYNNDLTGAQLTLYQSKSVIADTMQENIRRFYNGEALIPIEMVIIDATIKDKNGFFPNLSDAATKNNTYVTNAELRMIHKLMTGVGDPQIESIMRASFFMKEKYIDEATKKVGFRDIVNPWDDKFISGPWKALQQERNKKPERSKWISELAIYKNRLEAANEENTWTPVKGRKKQAEPSKKEAAYKEEDHIPQTPPQIPKTPQSSGRPKQ